MKNAKQPFKLKSPAQHYWRAVNVAGEKTTTVSSWEQQRELCDLYDNQVKFRHDLNWAHKRRAKTPQRNNADWALRLMSDDWLIFSTKRRFCGVLRAVSPDGCNRTWSLFFIPLTRQSLFLPSEVQSRVCRPAAIQTILCKNRSGAPSLSPLLSSSSCRLSSACLPIFSTHAGKKKKIGLHSSDTNIFKCLAANQGHITAQDQTFLKRYFKLRCNKTLKMFSVIEMICEESNCPHGC